MQKLILACGYNPFGYIILFFIVVIPFGLTLGIKWFFLAQTLRSKHRSLFLHSLGLTFIVGLVIGFVIGSFYVLPSSLFRIEIGGFYSYQFFIWAIVCIVDTFLIERWSIKPTVQAISLTDDQQLQVESVAIKYQPSWVAALLSNTLIGILIMIFFQMVN